MTDTLLGVVAPPTPVDITIDVKAIEQQIRAAVDACDAQIAFNVAERSRLAAESKELRAKRDELARMLPRTRKPRKAPETPVEAAPTPTEG